jgi:hypothetical protein
MSLEGVRVKVKEYIEVDYRLQSHMTTNFAAVHAVMKHMAHNSAVCTLNQCHIIHAV